MLRLAPSETTAWQPLHALNATAKKNPDGTDIIVLRIRMMVPESASGLKSLGDVNFRVYYMQSAVII